MTPAQVTAVNQAVAFAVLVIIGVTIWLEMRTK